MRQSLLQCPTLRENCLCMELFRTVFPPIWTEFGHWLRKSLYSFRMQQNTEQKSSKYGHFSDSVKNSMQSSWSGYNILKTFKIYGLKFFVIWCYWSLSIPHKGLEMDQEQEKHLYLMGSLVLQLFKFVMPFVSLFIWFLFFVHCFFIVFCFTICIFFILIFNIWLTW